MKIVLRIADQCKKLGISQSTLYRLGKQPDFPKCILIGENSSGRIDDELDEWLESRKGLVIEPVIPATVKRGRPRKTHAKSVEV